VKKAARVLLAAIIWSMVVTSLNAAPIVVINTFQISGAQRDVGAARKTLQERGFAVQESATVPTKEALSGKRVLWLLLEPKSSTIIEPELVQTIDSYVRSGGALLITIGTNEMGNEMDSTRLLLRHFQISLSPRPTGSKLQKLSSFPFKDLRLFSPAVLLLDVGEEAFASPMLLPNDLKQPTTEPGSEDRSGYRAVLGTVGHGKVAVIAGNELSGDSALLRAPEGDNREVLIRLIDWLASTNATPAESR
jgi:hypothetical protein